MTSEVLMERFRAICAESVPLPGGGDTPVRLRRLFEVGREDLSLAKLVEAHWDAMAILAEAGREPVTGALYGVWAAEVPGATLTLERRGDACLLRGEKRFCSGSSLIDRALITVPEVEHRLIDLDLRGNADRIQFDGSFWQTSAFALTRTANAYFGEASMRDGDLVGEAGWYLTRSGFWHGALGPAACWAGGAAGLVDYALRQRRKDAHTLAHLGAMQASVWAMEAYLEKAGNEIDADPWNGVQAQTRALAARHLIEQAGTDVLRRFARAYGPSPLAANETVSRRYIELDLYLRQSHAERDLETLGRSL